MKRTFPVWVFALVAALALSAGAIPANANTVFSQLWDSTPVFTGGYDKIVAQIGNGAGTFSAAMDGFNTGGTWTSTLPNQFRADATSTTPLDSSLGPNGNLWTFHFGSAYTTSFDLQVTYYLGDTFRNVNTWHYNGTGTGDNPVSSWSERQNGDGFVANTVPEPVSCLLIGGGLVLLASTKRWRTRKPPTT